MKTKTAIKKYHASGAAGLHNPHTRPVRSVLSKPIRGQKGILQSKYGRVMTKKA